MRHAATFRNLLLPVLAAVLAACATQPVTAPAAAPVAAAAPIAAAPAPCNTGLSIVSSTVWMQTAAEYDASTLQTYATARRMLDAALADPAWSAVGPAPADQRPAAVVLDLDETAIDNSAFEARMIRQGTTYTRDAWKQWVNDSAAGAIPGAREFLLYAKSRGVTPFYVTNRDSDEEPGTRRNLEKLGYPLGATEDTLFTRGERPEWKTSDKSGRREFVASKYRVLLLLGDDLNDFTPAAGKSREERDAIVSAHLADWGQRWIILPNAVYGSWEAASMGDTKGLSDCAKLQKKIDILDEARPATAPSMTSSGAAADLPAAIALALTQVERSGEPVTMILAENVTSEARRAAAALRKTIELASATDEQRHLPRGTVRLDEATMSGDAATVRIWTGPIPKAKPGELLLACGNGHTFYLQKNAAGKWEIKSFGVSVCDGGAVWRTSRVEVARGKPVR